MEREYGRRYRALYRCHWWWRAREALILQVLQRHLPTAARHRVLDVGCGDGLFFDRLVALGADVYGVEPDADLVRDDGPYRDRIHIGRFDDSYDTDRRFTLITMLDVLEHMPDPSAALRRARHVAAPGAWWLVTVPALRGLWTRHDDLNRHYARYTRSTLAQLLKAAQLEIVRLEYFFHWLVPVKLAVRLKERLLDSDPAVPGVPPRLVNRTLYLVSRMEMATVGRLGILPGSSLLACGRFGP